MLKKGGKARERAAVLMAAVRLKFPFPRKSFHNRVNPAIGA